jgi:glycosyltransferase involved in cell wall biosynthesis
MLEAFGLCTAFAGHAPDKRGRASTLAVVHARDTPMLEPASASFRVLAIVPTYNEEDVIAHTLRYLIEQRVCVYLLDNWSTDRTIERARSFLENGLLTIERFPLEGASNTYDLGRIMRRIEQISLENRWADWVMLHDADERRQAPWNGVDLKDALWLVQRSGFSCIDHVTLNFWPTDDTFGPESADLEEHFRYFEFSKHSGHFHQRRAWRQCGQHVSLTPSAGHDVQFEQRRVYPYKFLLKHYPIRSRAHGERKVLQERAQRWNPDERAQGWHQQYDDVRREEFTRDAGSLLRFEPKTFARDYLIERLSGAGVFEEPPPWATPPYW